MRKTSLDTGDNTSITSGIESETKKPGAGILKTTKNSIKRKVQHFSNECDDTANEPLLHKNKEKIEIEKHCAKYLISKTKTDFSSEKGDDKDKLLDDDKVTKPSISEVKLFTGAHMTIRLGGKGSKEQKVNSSQAILPATTHINNNLSNNSVGANNSGITKSQILIELDSSNSMSYSRSPLIFTTAKIHTDGKIQQMEPVQVTPGPILSTIEGGIAKTESKLLEKSYKTDNTIGNNCSFKKETTVTSPTFQVASSSTLPEVYDNNVTSSQNVGSRSSNEPVISDNTFDIGNKIKTETTIKDISLNSYTVKNPTAQLPETSKTLKDKTLSTKISQVIPDNKYRIENNVENSTSAKSLPKFSEDQLSSPKLDVVKKSGLNLQNTYIEKNYVDINKNFQPQSPADNNDTKPINNSADAKTNVAGSSAKEGLENSSVSSITTIKTCGETDKLCEKERIQLDSGFKAKKGVEKSNHNLTMKQTSSETKKNMEKEKTDLDSGTNAKESLDKSNLFSTATGNTSTGSKIIVNASNPSAKEKTVDNNMIINSDKSVKGVGIASNKTAIRITTEGSSIPVSISTRSTAPSLKAVKKETSPVTKASSTTSSSIMTSSAVSSVLSTGPKNIKLTPKLTSTTSADPRMTATSTKSTYNSSKTTLTTDSTKTTSSDPRAAVGKNPKTELESTKLTNTSQTTTITATGTASKSSLTGNSTSKVLSTALPKNVATVVSSIPKPTTTAPSMTAPKISNSKQSAFPSVTTASSVVKTSIVSQVPPDKTNSKSASNSGNKSSKLSTNEKTSTTTSSSGTSSTSLTAIAAKTATTGKVEHSETVKDSKGSKA